MVFQKTNIEEKLRSFKNKSDGENAILDQVKRILAADEQHHINIEKRLDSGSGKNHNIFDIDLLEADRIFHKDHIKKICIDYRLRFLDTKYFKGKIPQKAISKIKNLEKQHGNTISGFKIVAPSKLFKLENADDPLLFAPLGNDYYYLIHKWGNDLHPLRKLLVLPFKNLFNLILLVLLVSLICTELIPMDMLTKEKSNSSYLMLYFFVFKAIASIVLFYGFALGKNFNYAIWDSKYFNA